MRQSCRPRGDQSLVNNKSLSKFFTICRKIGLASGPCCIQDAENLYGFPLSFHQLRRAIKNIFSEGHDFVETKVNARIQAPAFEDRVHYELIQTKKIMAQNRCEMVF